LEGLAVETVDQEAVGECQEDQHWDCVLGLLEGLGVVEGDQVEDHEADSG
jgi:hypothetical protein